MKLKTEVVGGERLKKRLHDLSGAFERQAFKAIATGAYAVAGEARRLITDRSQKSGKTYVRGDKRPKTHQASAPGEAPANWEGKLRDGIKVYTDEGRTTAWVASSAVDEKSGHDYAPNLELGTNDGRVAKRPFLAPAYRKFKPIIEKQIKAAIRAAKKG